ncbi:MAG TPA: chemotaxis protein CheW, partial [Exilispira sp.]|nr:chemotaxis protein CheW [Exilispira sp.]
MAEIHVKSINDIVSKVDEDIDSKKIKNTVVQVIRFLIDKYEFALDVLDVKEIKEIEKIRHLPNSLPFIIGLLNLRGDIIPIFDLTKKLELENISVEKLASIGEKSG